MRLHIFLLLRGLLSIQIGVYAHGSLHDKGVINNEQLKILIKDHTGKKPSSKDNNNKLRLEPIVGLIKAIKFENA